MAADLLSEDSGTLAGDALSKLTLEGSIDIEAEELILPSTVKSLQSIKSSEKLYEVITLVTTESSELKALIDSTSTSSFQRRPLLHAYALGLMSSSTMEYSPKMLPGSQIVLGIVRKIPAADLEQAILMLPLPALISFIKIIEEWIIRNDNLHSNSFGVALLGTNYEFILLGAKLIFLILSLHATQLVHCKELYPILLNIRKKGYSQVNSERNLIGKNIAVMKRLVSISNINQVENNTLDDPIFKKRSSLF